MIFTPMDFSTVPPDINKQKSVLRNVNRTAIT